MTFLIVLATTVIASLAVGSAVVYGVIASAMHESLMSLQSKVTQTWTQLSIQLQQRADRIADLANFVSSAAGDDDPVLAAQIAGEVGDITRYRDNLKYAPTPQVSAEAHERLSDALGRVITLAGRSPDLKSSTDFLRLQEQIATNGIDAKRQQYDAVALELNTKMETATGRLVMNRSGEVAKAQYFTSTPDTTPTEQPRTRRGLPTLTFIEDDW